MNIKHLSDAAERIQHVIQESDYPSSLFLAWNPSVLRSLTNRELTDDDIAVLHFLLKIRIEHVLSQAHDEILSLATAAVETYIHD